ncbi:MAG: PAS domain S-box protein [Deltaproteobacteria bacterium]|nr:PAS domain S-box protein [Deltaproteobacteria bacterium]
MNGPPTPADNPEEMAGKRGLAEFIFEMVDNTPVGVLLMNADNALEYANPAACRILGEEFRTLIGRGAADLLGADCVAALAARRRAGAQAPGGGVPLPDPHVIEVVTRAGEDKFAEVTHSFPADRPGYTLCFLTDITTRKHLEFELQRQNNFFHNLIESSVDGIIAADMKGRIILFNSGAQNMLGYSKEEAYELHVTRLYPEGVARELLRKMRSDDYGGRGKLLRHELIGITKDGHHIPMSLSGGIIYDGKTEVATFGIFTDLRAIRKIEQDLEQTSKALVQSEKMAGLGRLAAGVAHEINNPMSGIMLYSNLILEQLGESHHAAADLKIIVHEAERCKQIVNDLLEFSHQTGHEQAAVDVNEQVRKSLGILHKQPLFDDVEVVLKLEEGLSRIMGNAIRLNQVFINIMVNAAQAMKGSGVLTVTTRHRSGRHVVEAKIADNGPGMEKDVLAQIFDPFFTTKANDGGTGLGLSVSYAIVKEHQGTIHVESEPGAGSTFILHFPAAPPEPAGGEILSPDTQLG